MIARRLRRADDGDGEEAARAFLAHWDEEESLHFRLEEELLLPAYAAHGDPDHAAVVRTLLDHMLIRRDVARLRDAPPLALLHELGMRLADHVKLEENELFPLIERTIPEPELSALGDRLGEAARPRRTATAGNTRAGQPPAGKTRAGQPPAGKTRAGQPPAGKTRAGDHTRA